MRGEEELFNQQVLLAGNRLAMDNVFDRVATYSIAMKVEQYEGARLMRYFAVTQKCKCGCTDDRAFDCV